LGYIWGKKKRLARGRKPPHGGPMEGKSKGMELAGKMGEAINFRGGQILKLTREKAIKSAVW